MLALVSEFNCFLRSRCSMEMWCPDDIGRDSWDWVGPPSWGRACFNSPEWGGGSSPVKTEPLQIVLLLLLCCCVLLCVVVCCCVLLCVVVVCCCCSEESMNQGLNSEEDAEKSCKHTAKNPRHHHRCQSREAREKRPVYQVQTARSKTAPRSIDWALFSIQTEWRGNAISFRVCRNVENVCNSSKRPVLMQNMYPLSNQEKRPRVAEESPEKSNAVLQRQHPHTGNVTTRY